MPSKTFEHPVVKGLLFIFLAIPGALISVFSGIMLVAVFVMPEDKVHVSYTLLLLLYLIGAIATLVGLGKIKQWLYILVFVAMAVAFWVVGLVGMSFPIGTLPFLVLVAGSAFVTYRLVDRHYAKQGTPKR